MRIRETNALWRWRRSCRTSNKARSEPLAVTSKDRVAAMPDVPTLYELGYRDIEDYNWTAMLAPKGTPADRVKIMSDAIAKALAMPDNANASTIISFQ